MRVVIVSKNDLSSVFSEGSGFQLEFYNTTMLNSLIDDEPVLMYVDISLWVDEKRKQVISNLLKKKAVRVGVIDIKDSIHDSASYFHMGCVDFVQKSLLSDGITTSRYQRVLKFKPFTQEELKISESSLYSSIGWSNIISGRKYIFGLMFIEIDNISNLRNDLGQSICEKLSSDLKNFLTDYLNLWNAYLWMWLDYGGIILFPYDGIHCDALEAAMELIINQDFVRFSTIKRYVTFRIVLHLGKTLFNKRGETGEIVSDSVNTLFHLGQYLRKPASLYISETMKSFIPESLKDYFVKAGVFENYSILKLKELK